MSTGRLFAFGFPLALSLCSGLPLHAASTSAAERDDVAEGRARLIRAHVTFLADDLLEGRAATTRGHALAMAYVRAQFERIGLEPGADGNWQQPVPVREARLDREAGEFVLRAPGGTERLEPINETIVRPAAGEAASRITAAAVFVGFGISAPEFGYDDFASGPDVRGKIAVVLAGSPTRLPPTARAHYTRAKAAELVRRGAVGVISVETPVEEQRTPWAINVERTRLPTMRLIARDGSLFEGFPELRATATVSRSAAAKLFRAAGKTTDDVFAASVRGEPQAFPLNVEITLSGLAEIRSASTANVLGWLGGSEPALAGEPFVLTAHLDHLGLLPAGQGDTIYNGALDNATGTAVLLAVAETLARGPRLKRPILFASLTGEEKGLLGSHHLAQNPPARVQRFAANLNLDMPVIFAPLYDTIAYGSEHSTLGPRFAAAAKRLGLTVSPDPIPDEVLFVRSDQYAFVRAGVPALSLKAGQGGNDGIDRAALEKEFRRQRYHQPGDDLSQPIHWPGVAAFAAVVAEFVRDVANDPVAPQWNPGDFFGTRFGPEKKNADAQRSP